MERRPLDHEPEGSGREAPSDDPQISYSDLRLRPRILRVEMREAVISVEDLHDDPVEAANFRQSDHHHAAPAGSLPAIFP